MGPPKFPGGNGGVRPDRALGAQAADGSGAGIPSILRCGAAPPPASRCGGGGPPARFWEGGVRGVRGSLRCGSRCPKPGGGLSPLRCPGGSGGALLSRGAPPAIRCGGGGGAPPGGNGGLRRCGSRRGGVPVPRRGLRGSWRCSSRCPGFVGGGSRCLGVGRAEPPRCGSRCPGVGGSLRCGSRCPGAGCGGPGAAALAVPPPRRGLR